MPYPYSALAVIRYKSPPGSTDGVSFTKGERVTVIAAADDDEDWLRGTNEAGVEGVFPAQFVEEIEEELKVVEPEEPVVVEAAPVDEAQAETPSSTTTAPVQEPTPTPAPAPAIASSTPTAAPLPPPSPKTSLSPPEAPLKPSSLRDRIAALNAAGAGAAPPPLPRTKPSFARKPIPTPSPALSPTPSPALAPTSIAAVPAASVPVETDAERGGETGAMSAEDAKASIGKGGSLKDRIAALQGLQIDTALPPPPGRAPKVWKRKEEPVVVEEEPIVDVAAADEPLSATLASPVDTVETVEAAPVKVEEDADPEATKRAALTARMAGLGGQRVGMAMPALPRKAGPPRRKAAAAAPVVVEPEEVVEVEPAVVEKEVIEEVVEETAAVEEDVVKEKQIVQEPNVEEPNVEELKFEEPIVDEVVPAKEDERIETPEESTIDEPTAIPSTTNALRERTDVPAASPSSDDDFDTPALPTASDDEDDFYTPSLPPSNITSPVPRPESPALDSHQSPAPPIQSPIVVLSPAVESETSAEEEDEHEEKERFLSPPLIAPVPVSPKRPLSLSRPPIPHDSSSPLVIDVAAAKAADNTSTPTSPPLSGRPRIPQIPMSFHEKQPGRVEKEAIVVPRSLEPEEEEEEEDVEIERKEEEPQSPVVRSSPPVRKVTIPVEAAQEEEDRTVEQEEEQEEDPEVKRRAALAKRMAALGGMNMRMGPMMPPIGGLRKSTKKDETVEEAKKEIEEEEDAPPPPPRRAGTIPTGGMLLPGIMLCAPPPEPEPESEPEVEVEEEVERDEPVAAESGAELVEQKEEEEVAPPPLPAGRPSTGPPRRSIPIPTPQDEDDVPPPLPAGRHTFVSEPETFDAEEEQGPSNDEDEAESDMDVPPPPARHLPSSPPLPPTALPPSSPPSRRPPVPQASKRDSTASFASLGRPSTDHRRSTSDGGLLGVSISRSSMDMDREMPGSPGGAAPALPSKTQEEAGNFKAREVDLATASQWWRAVPFAPPMSIRGRKDAVFDVSESTATKRGKTRHDNEIEVVYDDLSKSIVTVSFTDDDLAESTTSLAQAHFPPPPLPTSSQLLTFSNSLGAQLFAAAHAKLSDKSASRTTDESLLAACFARATDPLPPISNSYGIPIYALRIPVEGGSKARPIVGRDLDAPRAGDVLVLWEAKFKHNLSTKVVGSAEKPHVAVVEAWDGKKRKVKVIEVGKEGGVEEGSYRFEDLKAGAVVVFRAVPRSLVDSV